LEYKLLLSVFTAVFIAELGDKTQWWKIPALHRRHWFHRHRHLDAREVM